MNVVEKDSYEGVYNDDGIYGYPKLLKTGYEKLAKLIFKT